MNIKSLWIPFALFLLVAVPLRVYQVVYLIDPATGFFESGESLYQIFLGILALFVLIIMIMTASCKNTSEFQFRRNIFSGVFALAAAAAMATRVLNFILNLLHGARCAPVILCPDRRADSLGAPQYTIFFQRDKVAFAAAFRYNGDRLPRQGSPRGPA